MAVVYGYKLTKKEKEEIFELPKASLEYIEDKEYVTLVAFAEAGIDKITYIWNNEEIKELEMGGRTSHEEQIMLPKGNNILEVQVIDTLGQISKTEQEFSYNLDNEKPIIETEISDNAELRISATDETQISYVSYKWNEDEETIIEAENENDTQIETFLEVKRGKNVLTIKAADESGNVETLEKTFNGVNKPVIEVKRENNRIYMKIAHDIGFKKIEYNLNGKTYVYDENYNGYDPEQKEIEFFFELQEGENVIIILATSMENTQEVYKGKCDYIMGE